MDQSGFSPSASPDLAEMMTMSVAVGTGLCLSREECDDSIGQGCDAFLRPISDGETSTSGYEFSSSGKLSAGNTSSYCRGLAMSEESGNAVFSNGSDVALLTDAGGMKQTAKLFECPICHREFAKNFAYKVHVRGHTGRPYQCMICGRAFAQKSNARKHIERHKVFPYPDTSTQSRSSADDSVEKPSGLFEELDGQSKAESLVKRFDDCKVKSAMDHIAYRCFYCNDLFNCYRCLRKHRLTHKDLKVFQCSVPNCRQLFPELEAFLAHLPLHGSQLSYVCPICGKIFDSISDIGVHQCAHVILNETKPMVKKTYRCVECGDIFKSLTSLERHYARTSHQYRCHRCKKVYRSARRLRKHLKSHLPDLKFVCPTCKKTFAYSYTLKCHIKTTHEVSVVDFSCSKCSKKFKRRDVLRRHELSVHSAMSAFKCTYDGCDKKFKRQDRLKEHVLTHGGVKKHQCCHCGQSFVRLQACKMHVRSVHEKSYRFHCDICDKAFNRPDKFKAHKCRQKQVKRQ